MFGHLGDLQMVLYESDSEISQLFPYCDVLDSGLLDPTYVPTLDDLRRYSTVPLRVYRGMANHNLSNSHPVANTKFPLRLVSDYSGDLEHEVALTLADMDTERLAFSSAVIRERLANHEVLCKIPDWIPLEKVSTTLIKVKGMLSLLVASLT